MKIVVEPSVFEQFHEQFLVGVLFCSGVNNKGSSAEIDEMLVDLEELVKLNFTPEELSSHELISAWKVALAGFGEKFVHYKSNVEALMNQLAEKGGLPHTDKLNDLVTFISLKYIIPIGAFDADRVEGKIRLTVDGDLILRDDSHVLARKLQYETSPRAAVNGKTTTAVVLIEALPPFGRSKLESALTELAGLIKVFCGGKVKKKILDKENRAFDLK